MNRIPSGHDSSFPSSSWIAVKPCGVIASGGLALRGSPTVASHPALTQAPRVRTPTIVASHEIGPVSRACRKIFRCGSVGFLAIRHHHPHGLAANASTIQKVGQGPVLPRLGGSPITPACVSGDANLASRRDCSCASSRHAVLTVNLWPVPLLQVVSQRAPAAVFRSIGPYDCSSPAWRSVSLTYPVGSPSVSVTG